jgi:hypothetical protein
VATVQHSAFMNEPTMRQYQDKIWKHKSGPMSWGGRILGVFDSASAHITDLILARFANELNTDTAIIPGGCTSKAQPMDIGVNRAMKTRVRSSVHLIASVHVRVCCVCCTCFFLCVCVFVAFAYLFYCLPGCAQIRAKWREWMIRPNPDKTKAGNLKSPSPQLLCQWIKEAWDELPKSIIIKSFLKAGISNNLDGVQDDWIFEDPQSEQDAKEAAVDTDDDDGILVLRCAEMYCTTTHSVHSSDLDRGSDNDSDEDYDDSTDQSASEKSFALCSLTVEQASDPDSAKAPPATSK